MISDQRIRLGAGLMLTFVNRRSLPRAKALGRDDNQRSEVLGRDDKGANAKAKGGEKRRANRAFLLLNDLDGLGMDLLVLDCEASQPPPRALTR